MNEPFSVSFRGKASNMKDESGKCDLDTVQRVYTNRIQYGSEFHVMPRCAPDIAKRRILRSNCSHMDNADLE